MKDAAFDADWLEYHSQRSLERMLPRITNRFGVGTDAAQWATFERRLGMHFPRLFGLLFALYGHQYDFFYHLEAILTTAAQFWLDRPTELKALDTLREKESNWFQSNRMLGGVCYVDLFAINLAGLRTKIPYFKELGLTYLHLMPLFRCPEGNSDGGYAVSDYRVVNPALGTMDELRELATELRHNGISLVLDFIFNHTSDEHAWAQKALAGDRESQEYYFMFTDRRMPDAYEQNLREIFPDEHPGTFTFRPGLNWWVWTTFHSFQWDLNYSNPAVFTAMAGEMLFLANVGVEALRLDAVAFIWKQLGTTCENLPEAHTLIQAFNTLCRIAAPALLFKSEAIVHPDEIAKYIRPDECQLSYNPLLMALLWNSLATRKIRLLSHAMRTRFAIDPGCAWVNYVRCHDDIGWTFSDEDAAQLGVKGYDHRQFLNAFFLGRFPGSFARGLPFQENPKTGDCRISGTGASLVGLEQALAEIGPPSELLVELAISRILLIHGVIMSLGGIPLIYLGDEIGMRNDYSYQNDPARADDSRWVHRPKANWKLIACRHDPGTVEGRVYQGLRHLVEIRNNTPGLTNGQMSVVNTRNDHVFGYVRGSPVERVTVLANFSEVPQVLDLTQLTLPRKVTDLISGWTHTLDSSLSLGPYQQVWLIGS